jgi:methionine aminopeptidase
MNAKILKQALKEAERELDAATRLSDVNAAAKKLMRAKEALKALESERPKPRTIRASASAGAS